MAATKEQVLASLAKVPAPDGTPITEADVLSDVVVSDGKVFFSITVDAGEVASWEPVRKRAEAAVRAVPGVQSAMVALTAERKAGAAAARPPAGGGATRQSPGATAGPPRAAQGGGQTAQAPPGVETIAVASGRAVSASPRPRSIWRSASPRSASKSAFSMPTSTGRRCRSCWQSRSGRRRSAAPASSRSCAMG
jgi:hypothetical protein